MFNCGCGCVVNQTGQPEENPLTGEPYTQAERVAGIAAYTEELFLDLDYNILIIFTGLFIVSGSFVHTGESCESLMFFFSLR